MRYIKVPKFTKREKSADTTQASPYEKDWKTTFFGGGERYAKLLKLKKKYDPQNVLWCFPCVGGDVYREADDGKLYHI